MNQPPPPGQLVLVSEAITASAGSRRGPHTTYMVVRSWHAEAGHPGAFQHCDQQPCHSIHHNRNL